MVTNQRMMQDQLPRRITYAAEQALSLEGPIFGLMHLEILNNF